MTGFVLAVVGAYGVHLLYTALAYRWRGLAPGPSVAARGRGRQRAGEWMVQAGFGDVRVVELAGVVAVLAALGAAVAYTLFGGVLPPVAGGAFTASLPLAAARARRERRRQDARDVWPRLIEEIRIRTTTLGRSVPQALLDVGERAPADMRPAFESARREWLLTTDFERTVAALKAGLADATADAVGETLLVAHIIGGTEVDRTLSALVDDRILDLQGRKDARARQAGARFARRFVLVVPLGMALVGLSIGQGRAAYATATGQLLVLLGLGLMAACWAWAGLIMRLPGEERVFDGDTPGAMGGAR